MSVTNSNITGPAAMSVLGATFQITYTAATAVSSPPTAIISATEMSLDLAPAPTASFTATEADL